MSCRAKSARVITEAARLLSGLSLHIVLLNREPEKKVWHLISELFLCVSSLYIVRSWLGLMGKSWLFVRSGLFYKGGCRMDGYDRASPVVIERIYEE